MIYFSVVSKSDDASIVKFEEKIQSLYAKLRRRGPFSKRYCGRDVNGRRWCRGLAVHNPSLFLKLRLTEKKMILTI